MRDAWPDHTVSIPLSFSLAGMAAENVRFRELRSRMATSDIMKDFGRLQAYANPSNAGTRGPHGVCYGDFGFLPPGDIREATSGGLASGADVPVMGGIEQVLQV